VQMEPRCVRSLAARRLAGHSPARPQLTWGHAEPCALVKRLRNPCCESHGHPRLKWQTTRPFMPIRP
jgi:hypothetical protein